MLKSEVLRRLNDSVGISYQVIKTLSCHYDDKLKLPQVTTDAAGGMVSSRDFVYLFKIGYEGDSWVMGGKSVDYKDAPKASGIVRAVNGPGLQMVTPCQVNMFIKSEIGCMRPCYYKESDWCELIWLMDCQYNGMMLQRILDIALPLAQTSYVESVRLLAQDLKKQGMF